VSLPAGWRSPISTAARFTVTGVAGGDQKQINHQEPIIFVRDRNRPWALGMHIYEIRMRHIHLASVSKVHRKGAEGTGVQNFLKL
jgi:hypothetical protein